MTIRLEEPGDLADVRRINELAFGGPLEANLVDTLRRTCADRISLVAADGGRIVGHILFTPVVVDMPGGPVTGMGLAPMAVLPECQRQGVGTSLIARGLEILRERRCPFVVVVGHPEYYPRFGFERGSLHALKCQWETVPDEAFMVHVLDPAATAGLSGIARYRDEFNDAA